jgi:hypothetical protein
LVGTTVAVLTAVTASYLLYPTVLMRIHRDEYLEAIRACLIAKQSEHQAKQIWAQVPEDARDRLMAALELELVSCNVQQRIGHHLIASRVSADMLRAMEFGVLLESQVPLSARIEDLER